MENPNWLNKLISELKNKKVMEENKNRLERETNHKYNENMVNYLTHRKSFSR